MKRKILLQMLIILLSANLFAGQLADKKEDGYIAYIPKIVNKDSKMPLLLLLPGYGMSAKAELDSWKFYAEKKGFLAVAIYVEYPTLKTEGDVEALYQRIVNIANIYIDDKKHYSIDTSKVFIGGTSAGGMMSLRLSLMHQHRFRGTGVISGSNLKYWQIGPFLKFADGLDFILIHGRKDSIIPIADFYATKEALEKNGGHVTSHVNEDYGHTLRSDEYGRAVEWFSILR